MAANGTNLTQITNFESKEIGRTIGWDRQGNKIYFYTTINNIRNISAIRLEDGHMERLTYFDHPSHDASDWGGLSVFKDKIVFSSTTKEGDIWIMENFE